MISLAMTIAVHFSYGIERDLDFSIQENETSLTMSLSTGSSDSTKIIYSGFVYATIEYDEETLVPASFSFRNGGAIRMSDTDLSVTGNVNYPLLGNRLTTISLETKLLTISP